LCESSAIIAFSEMTNKNITLNNNMKIMGHGNFFLSAQLFGLRNAEMLLILSIGFYLNGIGLLKGWHWEK
jgi:hypothetical protein